MYRPLLGDEVRFIRIRPGIWTDPIQCDLVYLPLPTKSSALEDLVMSLFSPSTPAVGESSTSTEIPLYVALSYAWGNPHDMLGILLDGRPELVTVNLFVALRRLRDLLRHPYRAPQAFKIDGVMFWIDALCVDQSNIEEKSIQVPRMGNIYGSAALVLAWLGESGTDDSMIARLVGIANYLWYFEAGGTVESSAIPVLESSINDGLIKDTFESLLERSWFERIWVVQEVALAKHAIFLIGSHWCIVAALCDLWSAICTSPENHHARSLITGTRIEMLGRVRYRIAREFPAFLTDLTVKAESTNTTTTVSSSEDETTTFDKNCRSSMIEEVLAQRTRPTTLSRWVQEAQERSEGSRDAEELVRTRLYAYILRSLVINTPTALHATVEHDHLYGLLSMTGGLRYPRALAPDYSRPFSNVFHDYAKVILEYTGDLCIIPRLTNELEGVPSWVPDFRSIYMASVTLSPVYPLVSSSDVRFTEDGLVLIVEGVHLGEVICTSTKRDPESVHVNISNFERFVEAVSGLQSRVKEEVLTECLASLLADRKQFLDVSLARAREVYDDMVSGKHLSSTEADTAYIEDLITQLLGHVRVTSLFLTSDGIIGQLQRADEEARAGDVLAMMKGTSGPFMLRPNSTLAHGDYSFLGACDVWSGAALIKETERETQSFRIV